MVLTGARELGLTNFDGRGDLHGVQLLNAHASADPLPLNLADQTTAETSPCFERCRIPDRVDDVGGTKSDAIGGHASTLIGGEVGVHHQPHGVIEFDHLCACVAEFFDGIEQQFSTDPTCGIVDLDADPPAPPRAPCPR